MTTYLFHCPGCGAPLIPIGSSATMRCSHCQSSVIVPTDLRQSAVAETWPVRVSEGFVSNENGWLAGEQRSPYFARLNQSIANGRYRWEAKGSTPSSRTTAWLPGYLVSDFHLEATCKHIQGSAAASSWG